MEYPRSGMRVEEMSRAVAEKCSPGRNFYADGTIYTAVRAYPHFVLFKSSRGTLKCFHMCDCLNVLKEV